MKKLLLISVCFLSLSVLAKKNCIPNSHPDGKVCSCDEGYTMNPQGNVCCGPNAVWQDNKCNPCVKNAHPKVQEINGIDAAVSCEMDDVNSTFVDDKNVVGTWKSVDFVATPDKFTPGETQFQGKLFLKGLTFLEGGKTADSWLTWTKGVVVHSGDKTASKYEIKEIDGKKYMFYEWMSGDVTIRGMKPKYYVLKKQ